MNELFPGCYLRKARESADDGDENDADDSDDDGDGDDGNGNSNDGDMDAPNMYLEKSQGMRGKFLHEFSDDEVAEMCQVHNFMTFASVRAQYAMAGLPWVHTRTSLTLFMPHPRIVDLRQIR